jgi:hypothetical protein
MHLKIISRIKLYFYISLNLTRESFDSMEKGSSFEKEEEQ